MTNLLKARASGEPSYTFGAIGLSPDLWERLDFDPSFPFEREDRLCDVDLL